jgi:hypothetical protein
MKAGMLFTGSGPLVILTSYDSLLAPALREKLAAKGIDKFIVYELPVETVREKYGAHFAAVCLDLSQSDDLRVLDFSGQRAFSLFRFKDLGQPIFYDPE